MNSWPFHKPVDAKKVTDYYNIVKEPMGKFLTLFYLLDLEKVNKKLGDGMYQSKEQFKHDINKIFDNARIYNQEETIYYKYANQLQSFVKPKLDRLKDPVVPEEGSQMMIRRSRGFHDADVVMADEGEVPQRKRGSK